MIKFIRSDEFWRLSARIAAAVMLAACVATFGAVRAGASPITLGSATNYGILVGASDTFKVTGGLAVSGNLGLGNNDTLAKSGANSIGGNEYHDSSLTVTGGGLTISGTTVTQSMSSVISAAASASTSATALAATSGLVDQGKSISGTTTIKALTNLSENVLDISALSLSNGTLTFDDNGFTGAKFIINVTGAFSVGNSAIIKGINGASGADIIFNIEGSTGGTVSLTGNTSTSIIGTILAPQRGVTMSGGGTLTGEIIAGVNNAGTNYTVQNGSNGFNIASLGYTPRTVVNTPEPSSIALFGAGIFAFVGIRRLRRSRQH